jgi:Cu(I)/Ag(I) efflux system membrane fusion protein
MQWIRTGSKVDFTVQSLPGEKFTARITFVDPIMDPKSRVSKARAEMTNSSNKFKPEMFVTGKVTSELKKGSEITLPKSAIMWTGERSIVYLKKTSNEGVSFRLQEVVLGPSLGESYVIEAGLEPGMEVVVNGTFTIDAAAQLSGKPSMMNADFRKMKSNESISSAEFNSQLRLLLPSYLRLKDALVETNADAAATEAKQFSMSLAKIDASSLDGKSIHIWNPLLNKMLNSAKESSSNNDVEQQRKHLGQITDAYYEAITQFNLTGLNAYYQYCPMAFHDAGAYWISKEKEIRNPYYILDKSAQKATPVEAKEVQINLVVAGRPAQFTLPAKPEDDESEATSSRFQLTDEALCDALDAPKSKGRLQITIGGETYSGEMEAHDHDHD